MENPARVAHARAGNDHAGAGGIVERNRLLGRDGKVDHLEPRQHFAGAPQRIGLDIVELGMGVVDLRGFDGHRAVDVDGERRHVAVPEKAREEIDELLRPADGEGGYQDLATAFHGGLHDAAKLVDRFIQGTVVAVAVGGFEEDHVGLHKALGIAQHGRALGADVAGEHHGPAAGRMVQHDADAGGAEDVAGFDELDRDVRGDLDLAVVGQGPEKLQDGFDIGGGVERGERGGAVQGAFAVGPFDVVGLDLGGVLQDQAGEVDAGGCGVDRSLVAGLGQEGEAAGVVEVSMREDNGVEPRDVDLRGKDVKFLGPPHSLEHAEVEQDA